MSQPILVTGGAGFIGSHLVDELLAAGHEVVTLDNFNNFYDPEIKRKNCSRHRDYSNYKLIEGDILDSRLLDDCFKSGNFTQVIHLAARAGVRPSIQNPRLYHEVNIGGTLNILEACRKYNVKKLVLASSSSVYGDNVKVPFSENDSVDSPISPYASTKKACELMAYTYHSLYNIDTVCLRFFTVYGPRQRPEMAIHLFTDRIMRGREISLFGDGRSSRDYTYIADIIEGVKSCLTTDFGYEILNLGRSDPVKLTDLVTMLEKAIGKKARVVSKPHQGGDVFQTCANISKAQKLINYNPKFPIEKGLEQFVAWYKQFLN